MGARKRKAAEARKEALKKIAFAKLNDTPTSPRKMRLVADMIRGKRIELALNLLRFSTKEAAGRLEKLLLSAINNWQAKNEGERMEDHNIIVSEIYVDEGRSLKRLRPAPQGRGYRIRKRSNHVTIVLDSLTAREQQTETAEKTETTEQNA